MLKELISRYDSSKLECDGLTRVLHTVLSHEGVEHSCVVGSLTDTKRNKHVSLHFWIKLPDEQIIDYRARMWLGDTPDIPHGVFSPKDFSHLVYTGNEVQLDTLPQPLFDILTDLEA